MSSEYLRPSDQLLLDKQYRMVTECGYDPNQFLRELAEKITRHFWSLKSDIEAYQPLFTAITNYLADRVEPKELYESLEFRFEQRNKQVAFSELQGSLQHHWSKGFADMITRFLDGLDENDHRWPEKKSVYIETIQEYLNYLENHSLPLTEKAHWLMASRDFGSGDRLVSAQSIHKLKQMLWDITTETLGQPEAAQLDPGTIDKALRLELYWATLKLEDHFDTYLATHT